MSLKNRGMLIFVGIVSFGLAGCGQSPPAAAPATRASDTGRRHDGWWCDEHGVPEEVCALCDSKLAARFKAKGDWCKEHDRPESQCFACTPELEAKFAAQYEAKYGKEPPKPEAEQEGYEQ
ncbi:MAG TPA: RND transporter [Pirellulales bacterium]|nr:RND transporter [Pirellulales bacterium]